MRSLHYLGLLLALAACGGSGSWSRAGVSPEQVARDYGECRHAAELTQTRDLNIDTDILASRGPDWERNQNIWVRRDDYAAYNAARSGDFVERCMVGKGYTPGS